MASIAATLQRSKLCCRAGHPERILKEERFGATGVVFAGNSRGGHNRNRHGVEDGAAGFRYQHRKEIMLDCQLLHHRWLRDQVFQFDEINLHRPFWRELGTFSSPGLESGLGCRYASLKLVNWSVPAGQRFSRLREGERSQMLVKSGYQTETETHCIYWQSLLRLIFQESIERAIRTLYVSSRHCSCSA